MPARTLREAFNALDPRRPVTPEQVPALFVSRPASPVNLIKGQLLLSDRPLKMLFVGHRGAGKTSEMAYLSTLVQSDYLSIPIPIYDIFKSPAVSHTELVFAITLRLAAKATDESLVPPGLVTHAWEKLLEDVYDPLRRLLFGPEPIAADKQASITLKLSLLAAELEAKIGTEAYTRNQVKDKFEGRVADLLDQIGHLARLLEGRIERKLLLIVEDLDKFDRDDIRQLFLGHARTLTAPYPSVIYSFPVEMRYENSFKEIEQGFDKVHILPLVALKHRDGSADPEGRTTLENILMRRVDSALFAAGVREQLIDWSGGHVKSLIQLAQLAVLNAEVDNADAVVQMRHLELAYTAARNDYIALLKGPQIALLRSLYGSNDNDLLDIDQGKQDLLSNGSLLEYANTRGLWAEVNPIVVELLKRNSGRAKREG